MKGKSEKAIRKAEYETSKGIKQKTLNTQCHRTDDGRPAEQSKEKLRELGIKVRGKKVAK